MSTRKGSTKSRKKIEISSPSNFEHRVHTGYDALQGEFTDLPKQWAGVISPRSRRDPYVDPNSITNVRIKWSWCMMEKILRVYVTAEGQSVTVTPFLRSKILFWEFHGSSFIDRSMHPNGEWGVGDFHNRISILIRLISLTRWGGSLSLMGWQIKFWGRLVGLLLPVVSWIT